MTGFVQVACGLVNRVARFAVSLRSGRPDVRARSAAVALALLSFFPATAAWAQSEPTITVSYNSPTVALGGTRVLTVTIANPNAGTALTGVAVAASALPTNVTFSNLNSSTSQTVPTCSGANFSGGALSISGVALAAGASCQATLWARPDVAGTYSYTTGVVSATGPTTLTGSTATTSPGLTAYAPPVASSFTYGSPIPHNGGAATATTFSVTDHVTGNPTTFNVGSATSTAGGAVSITNAGLVSYTPLAGFSGDDTFTFLASNTGGSSGYATVTVAVLPPAPTVTSILPSAGPTAGGTTVTITGTGFSGATAVTFGATAATGYTVVSATQITATAPAGTGTVDVRVTTAGGTSATSAADQFTYVAAPTVTSITPTAGPAAGGATVVITGTGFSGTTAVTFGAAAATGFTVNSATQITATAPAGTGTVDVRVTTLGGTSATSAADQYTYVAAPTVISLTPNTGGLAGGQVTITGTGFTGATGVSFGGPSIPANTYTVVSDTSITATAPATGAAGAVWVEVTTPSGLSPRAAGNVYTYVDAPLVTGVAPSAGPPTGGTSVVVTGTNFIGVSAVRFGATNAQSFVVDSPTQITAVSPTGTAGVNVIVVAVGGTSPGGPGSDFTYITPPPAPDIALLSPNSGSTAGGTLVTIRGTDFTGATAVSFGGTSATNFAFQSDTEIIATSPAGTGVVNVRVTTPGGTSATGGANTYTYVAAPSISGLSPAEGVAHATTRPADVTITGTNFLASGNSVTFGGTTGTIVSEGTTSIVVTPPANASGGLVDVAVTSASTTTSTNAYRYLLPPTVTVTWSPATITTAQTTLFSVTVTNPNAVALQNVSVASSGATTPFTLTAFGQFCGSGNYNASSAFALTGLNLAAGASCTATGTQRGSAGVYQFVTNAPTSTGTATTAVTLTGVAATSNTITVYGTPTLSIITPSSGPLAGGQSFTLTGTNFNGATAVTIDGVAATDVTVVSATSITATTPAGASAGSKSVVITGPAGTGTRSSFYTYNALPTAPTITAPANGGAVLTLPTYSGSFVNAGSTVTVFVDGVSIGTVTPASGNSWSLVQPTALDEGPHTVDATATTANGTSAPSATVNFTVDGSAPAVPVVLTPGQSALINARTPTYSGTAEAGTAVTVRIDGAVIGTTVAAGGGAWSFVQPTDLSDGGHTLTATATDPAGNVSLASTLREFTIDATAPEAPAILAPVDGSTTEDNTPLISGTAEAGSSITVTIDGTTAGTTQANGSGRWSFMAATLADGAHTVSAVSTDIPGNGSASSATITFTIDATAPGAPVISSPVDGAVTDDGMPTISGTAEDGATVQLSINGAMPVSVTASGGIWSYTPGSALPVGPNTLSAVALDAAGNASPASTTVRFTYSPVAITTATLPAGQVGVAYSAMMAASGGSAPYGWTITSGALPTGLTLSSAGSLSGTPTDSGDYTFTITVTEAHDLLASQAYTVTIARPADPVVTDVSDVEVTADPETPGEPTMIDLSGAVQNATRIEIVPPPVHGLATINGFEVTYTPATGYFGPDSFTYRAVGFDDGGAAIAAAAKGGSPTSAASEPATVSIVIVAPTLVLTGGTLPSGQVGAAYSQTLAASAGTAPYSYAVTSGALPAGISLATDGTLSGAPTAGGNFTFDVTATDSSTGTGPFSVTAGHALTIDAPALAVTPASVPSATAGTAYSTSFSASGGVAPYSYAVTTGSLPAGLTLATDGLLSGVPAGSGVFDFTVTATDSSTGAGPYSASVPVSLTVAAADLTVTPTTLAPVFEGTVYSQQMQATGGQGGYSFVVSAGALPTGLTLSGTGLIRGRATASGDFAFTVTATDGFGNAGSVALTLKVDGRPDPAANADVAGLNTAQAEATRRLAGTQMDNFNRRLETLHNSRGPKAVDLNLNLDGHAFQPLDQQQLVMGDLARATGQPLPDDNRALADRRDVARLLGTGQGQGLGLAAQDGAGSSSGTAEDSALRIWAGGAISLGERDATSQTSKFRITTSGISAGADMRVADNLDVGIGLGFGQENTDVGTDDSRMEARSWVGVAYGSWRPAEHVFLDGVLGYGQTGFDTRRRTPVDSSMVVGERDGSTWFGSLSAGLDRMVGPAHWITYGRLEMLDARLDAYTETGSPLWALAYDARSVDSLQGALGVRYQRRFERRDDSFTPGVRLEWRHEFADGSVQSLRYADWLDGPAYTLAQTGWTRSELSVGLSLDWEDANGWSVSTGYDTRISQDAWMGSLKLMLSRVF